MSYQMVNTLPSYNIDVPSPCSTDDVRKLAKTSVDYVEGMKDDNNLYVQYLRKNATIINHYEMLADLYDWNEDFGNSTWFRYEKMTNHTSICKSVTNWKNHYRWR